MIQTSNFNSMGVYPLTKAEINETNGGIWWFPPALVIGLVVSAANNFGDIREGLADGWKGTPRH